VGTQESVNALRTADLESFHQAKYLPNNTALIVVGAPMARLSDIVREKFGNWIKARLQPMEPGCGANAGTIRRSSHRPQKLPLTP